MDKPSFVFHLNNGERKAACISMLANIEPDGKYMVKLMEAKQVRTLAQNALYWGAWLPYIGKHTTGQSVEELHDAFKRCYLPKIIAAEQANKQQVEWYDLYMIIYSDGTDNMRERMLKLVSTTWLTVSQFTTYLEMIEHFCADKQIGLPCDRFYEEAGLKKI